ncbi:NUDIX domain-containing protein [Kitasatospora sp. CM 4170]|uniref:NUDIX domain-containing protein n=1 Tax=Kitasatospora aburaviensis TaxID=67265 RepID=A0ABW1F6Z4_9ACTN|nr:NUDIX domain-containing protein [Kitasatospora sp. CM 4170]WNM43394.1 NUDIX domain-containing protein [Kitasatospora sp. CM 4170]
MTASTFLLHRDAGHWIVGLIWHDRLGGHMPAGGHGEVGEGVHDAALREVLEETGHKARLIPGPAAPTPAGFPHRPVPAPWWICEGGASPDGHTSTPHTHVDHIYLALVDSASAATEQQPDHQLTWFTHSRLSSDPTVSEDSRLLALQLMTWLDGAPAGAEDDPMQLSAYLAHRATTGLLPAQHSQKEEPA